MGKLAPLGYSDTNQFSKAVGNWLDSVDRLLRDAPIVASLATVTNPGLTPPVPADQVPAAGAAYVQAAQQVVVDRVNALLTDTAAVINAQAALIAKVNEIVAALGEPIGA